MYLAIRDRSLDFALRSCDIYIDKRKSKYSIFAAWAPDDSMTLQTEIQPANAHRYKTSGFTPASQQTSHTRFGIR